MNRRARALGMYRTEYKNAHGLDVGKKQRSGNYSTAYDMALLCRYAMQNEPFSAIVSQKKITVHYVYPENKTQLCVNHNKLLSLYDGCIGIKTGFTKKAGRTLTSCAERDGIRLIAVTLHAPDDWNDHKALYDYGFARTERKTILSATDRYALPVVGGQTDTVAVRPETDYAVTMIRGSTDIFRTHLMLPHFIYAPVTTHRAVGEIAVYRNDQKIASVRLLTESPVELQKEEDLWKTKTK